MLLYQDITLLLLQSGNLKSLHLFLSTCRNGCHGLVFSSRPYAELPDHEDNVPAAVLSVSSHPEHPMPMTRIIADRETTAQEERAKYGNASEEPQW